jgi:predicted PurR-regulated permease PerM
MRAQLLPVSLLATVLLLWLAKPVLVPLLIAFLLAELLSSLAQRLERYMPELLAAILAVGVMFAVAGGAVLLLAGQLSALEANLPAMAQRIGSLFDEVTVQLGRYLDLERQSQATLMRKGIDSSIGTSSAAALTALTFTMATVAEAAFIGILVFVMLYFRRHFRRQLKRIGDLSGSATLSRALDRTAEIGHSYVASLGLVMLGVGIADTIGLLLIGSPFPAVFGFLGAVSVLIPYVGIAVTAPACALLTWLATGSSGLAGGVFCVFLVVHFLEGNFISPFFVGSRVSLNPLATLVAILVGGQVWGPAGMVLFIPLLGIVKLALESSPDTQPWSRLLGPITENDLRARRKATLIRPEDESTPLSPVTAAVAALHLKPLRPRETTP